MLSVSDSNRVGVVAIFDYTSRYLSGLLGVVILGKWLAGCVSRRFG